MLFCENSVRKKETKHFESSSSFIVKLVVKFRDCDM